MGDRSRQFAEETLGDRRDVNLLMRLLPYAAPYRALFGVSVVLVILITLVDLSLPYITKITIDTYIVPPFDRAEIPSTRTGGHIERRYRVDLSDRRSNGVVRKYADRFTVDAKSAEIRYADLPQIPREDLIDLRHRDLSGIAILALVLIVVVAINFGLIFLQALLMEYTGQMIMHRLRADLFAHTQRLSVSFFSRNPVGRLTTRVTNDIQNMHELFTSVISFVFKDLFLLVGIVVVLLTISTRLALISFLVLPVVFYTAAHFARVARSAFRELRIKIAEINTRFSETIQGIRIVQLFRYQAHNFDQFKRLNHEHYLAGMMQVRVFAVFMPVIELMGTVAVALVIYFGGGGVLEGRISLGALVAFLSYMRMFFRPIRDIAEKFNILQNAMASAERIFMIMDHPRPHLSSSNGSRSGINKIERLKFDRVSFAYHEEEPVLKGVSFDLESGSTLAVVGPTGAGKTSLINLIVRFYDPTDGTIFINDRPITDYAVADLRERIALVTQDPFLFSGSIRENILPSARDKKEPDWRALLSAANCHDFIARLPRGLDTVLAEGGISLSSGERQLLSIARAFARDPDLIILDEATSYIDAATEQQIQRALTNLITDRSAIIIAHRLSTARSADSIMTLYDGRIIESGSHEQLMRQTGYYYRLNQIEK